MNRFLFNTCLCMFILPARWEKKSEPGWVSHSVPERLWQTQGADVGHGERVRGQNESHTAEAWTGTGIDLFCLEIAYSIWNHWRCSIFLSVHMPANIAWMNICSWTSVSLCNNIRKFQNLDGLYSLGVGGWAYCFWSLVFGPSVCLS